MRSATAPGNALIFRIGASRWTCRASMTTQHSTCAARKKTGAQYRKILVMIASLITCAAISVTSMADINDAMPLATRPVAANNIQLI